MKLNHTELLAQMIELLDAYNDDTLAVMLNPEKSEDAVSQAAQLSTILNRMRTIVRSKKVVGDVAIGFGKLAEEFERDNRPEHVLQLVGIYSASVLCYVPVAKLGLDEFVAQLLLGVFTQNGGLRAMKLANEWLEVSK